MLFTIVKSLELILIIKGFQKTTIDLVDDRGSLLELVSDAKDLVLEFSYHCEVVPDSILVPHEPYMFESNKVWLECALKCGKLSQKMYTPNLCLMDVYK